MDLILLVARWVTELVRLINIALVAIAPFVGVAHLAWREYRVHDVD